MVEVKNLDCALTFENPMAQLSSAWAEWITPDGFNQPVMFPFDLTTHRAFSRKLNAPAGPKL